MKVVMVGLAVAYVGMAVRDMKLASDLYGDLWFGMNKTEALYGLGTPGLVANEGGVPARPANDAQARTFDRWTYPNPQNGRLTLAFDRDGRTRTFACTAHYDSANACPPVMGIGIGMDELGVLNRLGLPDRQSYEGDVKTLSYDAVGLDLRLRRYRVFDVRVSGAGTGFVARLVRYLVP